MSAAVRPQHVPPISVRLHDGESPNVVFAPVDLPQFVKACFDGAIEDHSPYESVDDAEHWIVLLAGQKFGGRLTVRDLTLMGIEIALEFNRRSDATGFVS